MRYLLIVFFIALLAWLGQLWFPWWIVVAAAFLGGLLSGQRPATAFLSGFLAIAILWGGYALWYDAANEGILSARMARLFGELPAWSMPVLSAILGGLLGGMGSLTGAFGRRVLFP